MKERSRREGSKERRKEKDTSCEQRNLSLKRSKPTSSEYRRKKRKKRRKEKKSKKASSSFSFSLPPCTFYVLPTFLSSFRLLFLSLISITSPNKKRTAGIIRTYSSSSSSFSSRIAPRLSVHTAGVYSCCTAIPPNYTRTERKKKLLLSQSLYTFISTWKSIHIERERAALIRERNVEKESEERHTCSFVHLSFFSCPPSA